MLRNRIIVILTLALIVAGASQALAIQRVAPKWNLLEFRGGYGMPQGTYNQVIAQDFIAPNDGRIEFDAKNVYNNGFNVGISYGRLVSDHWLAVFGFDFVQNRVANPIEQRFGNEILTLTFLEDPTFRSYDASLKVLYEFLDLNKRAWSPFVGLNGTLGLSALGAPGYTSETSFTFATGVDFGLDLKVWQAPDKRSYLTLSSINSWEFMASGDRARLLRVGGGLKYFFRP